MTTLAAPDLDAARTLLGVVSGAASADLRRAFRQRAFALHPDRNPDPGAADAFRAVREAYDALAAAARDEEDGPGVVAEIAAAAEAAAREAQRRRRRTAAGAAAWQAVRVGLAPPPAGAFARAAAWLRRDEPASGPLAAEVLAQGLRDLRWTVTLAWDEVAAAVPCAGRLELVLTRAAARRLEGRVPLETLAPQADGTAIYRLPLAEPERLAAIVQARARPTPGR